jgi:hypothetical protein
MRTSIIVNEKGTLVNLIRRPIGIFGDKSVGSYTDKEIVLSLSVLRTGIILLLPLIAKEYLVIRNSDQTDYLIWLASRQKYSPLAMSTTSWFLPLAPAIRSAIE